MTIYFSGDDASSPVSELIGIDKTDRSLVLQVKAYATGGGNVTYSWDGVDPCPQITPGCELCDSWYDCQDDLLPVCDGSSSVQCSTQEVYDQYIHDNSDSSKIYIIFSCTQGTRINVPPSAVLCGISVQKKAQKL